MLYGEREREREREREGGVNPLRFQDTLRILINRSISCIVLQPHLCIAFINLFSGVIKYLAAEP